ncbi:Asp-tRNA(Asn)/Glu-tRNA(Gln) amidotransferase subunit GatC [candidate division TA06 bacterium]|nr:Asp-tRNA(Asn)/Glu-tRNA(Gln) amidotransferase subunit GatC [candidate division TA06 bacterium]
MEIITEEEVRHVARLARLALSEEEVKKFQRQLEKILEYVAKLRELNLEGVEPTTHVIPVVNRLREDRGKESLSKEEALSNAPNTEKGHFRVPKVIE